MISQKAQNIIWNHFQNQKPESFAQSAPRLKFLVDRANKIFFRSDRCPTVLNIGVGNGELESQCVKMGWNTYSLDPSEASIQNLHSIGSTGKVGYIDSIPYENNTFDFVFCSEVIEHLSEEQIELGLKEINRVLVDGGYLIGTVPFNEDLQSNQFICPDCGKVFHVWGHQQSFNIDSLSAKLSACLKIEEIYPIYFVSWSHLNIKGIVSSVIKLCLSKIRIYGTGENIFFMVKK